MSSQAQRFYELLEQLEIQNRALANAIPIDPAMITRWKKNGFGRRHLRQNVQDVAEYIARLPLSPEKRSWLSARLSLPKNQVPTAAQIALWLAPEIRYGLTWPEQAQSDQSKPPLIDSFHQVIEENRKENTLSQQHTVLAGMDGVAGLLELELENVPVESRPQLFLSSEMLECAIHPQMLAVLRSFCERKRLHCEMLLQSANNSERIGQLISTYLPLMVCGLLELNVMHGIPAAITGEMKVILPGCSAVLISEVAGGDHSVMASVVREPSIVEAMSQSFRKSLPYARPMLKVYDDSFARNIIEIFYSEYGVRGHLDVIKCGMNPMYLTVPQYGKILAKMGNQEENYRWRYQEFDRFKQGIGQMMQDSRNREILCLPKLREIAQTGCCRMPSMYFFGAGVWTLDAEDCVNLFDGYIHDLNTYEAFQVVLLDDESLFMNNSCWHIKNNRHIMIHSWDIDHPIMVYSEEMLLIDEFQKHFDGLWNKISAGTTKKETIDKLTQLRDECAKRIDEQNHQIQKEDE